MHTADMEDSAWPTSETADDELAAVARRAARLDHTLRTMEALDAFRTEAAALRAELHELREARAAPTQPKPPVAIAIGLPDGVARLLVEAGFLVAVAVVVWLAELSKPAILAVMGSAWLATAAAEALWTRRIEASWSHQAAWPLPPTQTNGSATLGHTLIETGPRPELPPATEPEAEKLTRATPRRRGGRSRAPA